LEIQDIQGGRFQELGLDDGSFDTNHRFKRKNHGPFRNRMHGIGGLHIPQVVEEPAIK
jgi:hypothetical protein